MGHVEKTLINSALVSAQNRQRYYWTNFEVTQPEDKGILLKDIIEGDFVDRDKSYCIDANYHKGGNPDQYFNKSRRQLVFGGAIRGRYNGDGSTSQKLECNNQEKTNSLTTVQKDNVVVFNTTDNPRIKGITEDERGGISYRKLTPIECERLQTIPDNWTDCISNTQRYRSIGNGWTIDVIAHILKCAFK